MNSSLAIAVKGRRVVQAECQVCQLSNDTTVRSTVNLLESNFGKPHWTTKLIILATVADRKRRLVKEE